MTGFLTKHLKLSKKKKKKSVDHQSFASEWDTKKNQTEFGCVWVKSINA